MTIALHESATDGSTGATGGVDGSGTAWAGPKVRERGVSPATLHFLGIGAQKAGTTWLYERLRNHPRLCFPAGKEVHFWDNHLRRGVEWYRRLFAVDDGKLHGEITPRYAILSADKIRACHAAFPHLKIIYTLRNPIDRAWSAAKMELLNQGRSVGQASPAFLLEMLMRHDSLARGDYETSIRNWLRVYPKASLLVLRFEDLVENPNTYLARCLAHLGVDDEPATESSGLFEPVNQGPPGEMPAALRRAMRTVYYRKILSLADYLDEDLGEWLI